MDVGIDRRLLTQTEQMCIVVIRDRIVIPARHADRPCDPAGLLVHRPWHANAAPAQTCPIATGPLEQPLEQLVDPVQDDLRSRADGALDHSFGEYVTGGRAHGHPTMSCT